MQQLLHKRPAEARLHPRIGSRSYRTLWSSFKQLVIEGEKVNKTRVHYLWWVCSEINCKPVKAEIMPLIHSSLKLRRLQASCNLQHSSVWELVKCVYVVNHIVQSKNTFKFLPAWVSPLKKIYISDWSLSNNNFFAVYFITPQTFDAFCR